jgi:hypothetical protein
VNSLFDNWNNVVVPYVTGSGLTNAVDTELQTMKDDGTLASLINDTLFNNQQIETTSALLGAKADNTTDDSTVLNNYLTQDVDRFLFLNQGKYLMNNPLTITQPNTILKGRSFSRDWGDGTHLRQSALVANHSSDIVQVSVPSSENGVFMKDIALYGNGKASNGLNIYDYIFSGSLFENIKVSNVLNTAYILAGDNYDLYFKRLFSAQVKTALSIQKGNTNNTVFNSCHLFSTDVVIDLLTNFDSTANTGKLITFSECDLSHGGASPNRQVLVQTGKVNNVIFDNCYFESPQTQNKPYLFEFGTPSGTTSRIKFRNCHFAGSNYDYFAKLTNVLFFEFDNCYFESNPNIAWFKASTNIANTIQQNIYGTIKGCVLPTSIPYIGCDSGDTPLHEENVFHRFDNNASVGSPHQRNGMIVSNSSLNNYIFEGVDNDNPTYPYPYFYIKKNALLYGDGKTGVPSAGMSYNSTDGSIGFTSANVNGKLYALGTWQKPFQLGYAYLWCNANYHIMGKAGSAPTSDTDGTQIV